MTMKKQYRFHFGSILLVVIALALALSSGAIRVLAADAQGSPSPNAVPAPKHTPNPSSQSPPTPGFEKFAILDTNKFYQTQSFSVFNSSAGSVKNVQYNYVYRDGRFEKVNSYDTDVNLEIFEFASPEKARTYLKKKTTGAIPEAKASSVKLPPCKGEKRDNDNFVGPAKIAKTLRHPNGSEIVVMHSGDFNMWDCKRGNNRDETVLWTDGVYYFKAEALPMSKLKDDTAHGRAEEFAIDYLAALGQPVAP